MAIEISRTAIVRDLAGYTVSLGQSYERALRHKPFFAILLLYFLAIQTK